MAITKSRETVIEATPEEIMQVFFDLESLAEWSPIHSKAEVIERDAEGRPKLSRQVVRIVGISDEQVLDYSMHDDGVSWTLVSSKQLRAQEGRYTLAPEGDKTRVTVELTVEFNVPLPGFLITKGTQVLLDAATAGLRKRVLEMKGT